MRIVVTGASGFVGRHVLPVLIENGHEVVAVVRDEREYVKFDRQCLVVRHEIGTEDGDTYSKLGRPDALLHLAWGGLPDYRSLHHIEVELPIHYRFIKLMVESGVKYVSVVGTCFEYGMQSGRLSEEMETRPNNPYGYAKDALRRQLFFLQQNRNFKLTWMRLFYMYGEDQPDNTLYSQLRAAVLRGDSVFNMSGGEQLRDYVHIDETAKWIVGLTAKKEDVGIVNVCSGTPISVRRLVEQWKEKYGWNIALNLGYYPYPDYEPMAFWGSKNYMKSLLMYNNV